jgi:hypothetical protein
MRPKIALVLPLLLLPFIATSTACKKHEPLPAASGAVAPSTSEAQRTREMEDKARDLDRRTEELKTMQGTDQEKIDAANKIDQERRDLQKQSEGGSGQ